MPLPRPFMEQGRATVKYRRAYGGNECPLVEAHGPMLVYADGRIYYCPNSAHSCASPPASAVFSKDDQGAWVMLDGHGAWVKVDKPTGNQSAPGPVDSTPPSLGA